VLNTCDSEVLPSFGPPKEKLYVMIVACIVVGDYKVAEIGYDLA
jgi:hypothetical protein